MKEETLDELKKTTLGSYVKKASKDLASRAFDHGEDEHRQYGMGDDDEEDERVEKDEKKIETRQKGISRAATRLAKEETLDEAKKGMWPGTPEYKAKFGTDKEKHEAKYGKSDVKKLAPYGYRDKSEYEKAKEMKEEKSFSAMLESYKEGGLKYIASLVKEEPDNEQYTKEVEEVKKKASEKKSPEDEGRVAKAKVDAVKVEEEVEELDELSKSTLGSYVKKRVKQLPAIEVNYQMAPDEGGPFGAKRIKKFKTKVNKGIGRAVDRLSKEETEIAVINADAANGVEMVDIAEREMTDAEMKKREDIVKGMKKGMQGFKQRYGDRAKSVMYATATKQAMKD